MSSVPTFCLTLPTSKRLNSGVKKTLVLCFESKRTLPGSLLPGGSEASSSSFAFLSLQRGHDLPDVSSYVLTSGSNYRRTGNGNDG